MTRLRFLWRGWWSLFHCDLVLHIASFKRLHDLVHRHKLQERDLKSTCSIGDLCHAMDLACVFYFKRVLCLQRSAATTCLLREYGWAAEMVIGVQMLPFRSHAWVEVNGQIVNDKPYMTDIYRILKRC